MTHGAQLHVEEYGTGAPLVLLHGLMTNSAMFDNLGRRLASWFRVIVPDLRGHGRSIHLAPPTSIRQMAADLVPVLAERGIASADVIGYSLGGAVALQLALDHAECVRKMVLIAAFATERDSLLDRIESALMGPALRVLGPSVAAHALLAVPGVGGGPRLPGPTLARVRAMLAASDKRQMIAVSRAIQSFDIRARLPEIQAPTLVIVGDHDWTAPVRQSEQLATELPHAKLAIIEGAGHTIVWTHEQNLIDLIPPWLGVAAPSRVT